MRNANSSTSGLLQLNTVAANGAVVAIQSGDLKNHGAEDVILKSFDTQAGPGAGIIPASSTLSFTIWMKKTATNNNAVVYPRVAAGLDWGSGVTLCQPTNGTSAIGGTQSSWTVTCTTPASDINMAFTQRIWVSVGYHMTTGPGNHSMSVELDIEGTSSGATDTRVQVPNAVGPTISGLSATSGPVNWPVTISGTYFGSSQGTGSVKFNGTTAAVSSWSTASIQATVPAGATTGAVRVTTSTGRFVDGPTFTVTPPPTLTSLSVQTGHIGDSVTISGNNFLSTQGSSTVTFNGTSAGTISGANWSNAAITTSVPSGAASGSLVVTVSGQASNVLPFTIIGVPALTSAVPASAQPGASVTVTGSNFGATQGSSTIKFHGTTATPTYWSNTAIIAPVPATATSGDIVVAVANQASNGLAFTVTAPGTISGTITQVTGGASISGATVQALLSGVQKGSATSAANGTYSIPSLDPGTYEVWTSATGFSNNVRQNIAVTSSATTTVNVGMSAPGAISGTISQSDGVTPIVGAAVTMFAGSTEKGTANTSGSGGYTITGLPTGSYTVRAANVGYHTVEQSTTIAENGNTNVNISLEAAAAGSVSYAYDELGRLVQVTDPSGDSAIYRYDPVGNITAIERANSTTVAVSEFTPNKGPVGTSLTIDGTGFSATANQNHAVFGCGQSCTVEGSITSATATQLVTTIPASALTGPFTVTSPNGSAGSGGTFTITASDVPTITSFTPQIGVAGTQVVVSGTNFETTVSNDRTKINVSLATVSASTTTSLTTTVPTYAGSGPISVSTPSGTGVSAADFFVPPSPYTAADVDYTDRIQYYVDPQTDNHKTATVTTANHIGLLTFSGTAGQRFSLSVANAPNQNMAAYISILKPNLTPLVQPTFANGGLFVDATTLPSTGSYTIVFDPDGTRTGSMVFTLYGVPPDAIGTIVANGQPAATLSLSIGQNAVLAFTGTANQRVSLAGTGTIVGQVALACDVTATIVRQSDNQSFGSACMEGSGYIDVVTLGPQQADYKIVVDPYLYSQGNLTLTLYTVTDYSGTITADGTATPVPLPTPGQNGSLTFTSTPNQRVSLAGSGTISGQVFLTCDVTVTIVRASDNQSFGSTCMEGTGFIDTVALGSLSETYKVLVDPDTYATGTLTLKLYTVPADQAGTLTVNDPASPVSLQTPGQNASYTFTPSVNQQITVRITGSTVTDGSGNCMSVALLQGTTGITSAASCAANFNLQPQSLTGGTQYTVTIDPVAATKVTLNLQVTSP